MRAELCPRRGSPPRTSPPSRAGDPRSVTELPATGAPAARACPGPDSCGAGRSVSGVLRGLGFAVRRGTGGRAARARSGLCAAVGLLLAFAALLALPLQAQAQTDPTTPVTIEAQHESIGAGLEDLVFTLTRGGDTTDELTVMVIITQDQLWLDASDLSHNVTFPLNSATAELTIAASKFSFTPSTTGDLIASVMGDGIDGGSDTVQIISTSGPPITISYEESDYTFAENATDPAIYVLATLDAAYPRGPSNVVSPVFPSRIGTAESPEDYAAISWRPTFVGSDFARATDDIDLVYNDDLSKIWELSIHEGYQSVQRFRTGMNPDGYVLSQVGLWLRRIDSGGTPVVTIHQQDRPGPPGPALWTLTNPTTFENDTRHMFSAPENTVLLPSQGYSVRVSAPDAPFNSRFLLGKTLHVGSEGAEGWKIDATDLRYASTDGGNNWESGPGTHSMRITGRLIKLDEAAVTADAVQLTSSGPYYTGNVITAAVTFSEAVDVTGAPTLALLIGENSRRAAYVSGDGSSELVFSYTVVDADQDSNGVSVPLSALAVPTGASITKQGTDQSAVLNQLPRLDGKLGHKVNSGPVIAGRPTITSTPMASADTYGLAETVEITVTFDEPVIVDTVGGLPTFDISVGGYSELRTALYVRGSGNDQLVFAYVVQLGDRDTSGISMQANQLKLNSGTIRSPDGRDALLEHRQKLDDAGHKVDAQLTSAAAVLSELALSSVTLVPGFDATIIDYTASVGVDIGFTTVTATAPSGVTASIVPADADANTQGHQVMLDLGVTTITVTASKTGVPDFRYTVKVTRERANNTRPTASQSSATTNEDTPYTFKAADFNFSDADVGDELHNVVVVNLPGAGRLTLDGVAVSAREVVSEAQIGLLVFTPAADEFNGSTTGTYYTRFEFRVSDGQDNSPNKYWFELHVDEVNDAPTGLPRIVGNARVGAELTANITHIEDADGLNNVSFIYKWIRVDGGTETTIADATAATYTLTDADEGMTIKVSVSFEDNNSHDATVTSDAWPANGTIGPVSEVCARTGAVRDAIVDAIPGVSNCDDVTSGQLAAITGRLLLDGKAITGLAAGDFAGLTGLERLFLNNNRLSTLPAGVFAPLTKLDSLNLDSNELSTLPADLFSGLTNLVYLYLNNNGSHLRSLPAGLFDDLAALRYLHLHANRLPTLPAELFDDLTALENLNLNGNRLRVQDLPDGIFERLTALTSLDLGSQQRQGRQPIAPTAIAGPDNGRVSSVGGEVELDGSGSGGAWGTNVTYDWELTTAPTGTTVAFDDAAADSPRVTIPALPADSVLIFTLTVSPKPSGAIGVELGKDTATVTVITGPVTNIAPLASDSSVTTDEDTAYSFAASDFSFTDEDYGDELASVTVVTLPAVGALELDGVPVVVDQVVMAANISKLAFTPAANANGSAYASFTFKVSDGTDESASAYTMTVNVTPVNDPATGLPTIDGTVQAGEMLTAVTTGIADVDGLSGAIFSYRWIYVDISDVETDVGTDSDTYRALAANVGGKVKVEVSFTDDGLTTEELTSAAVGPVVPALDTTAPRVTSIERHDPTESLTNAETLTWRVTFSEDVANVDAMDFAVSGTTATLAASAVANMADVWDVTASGGDLASRNNTVTLSFAAGQNIYDTATNVLSDIAPTGTNDDDYVLDNTAPTVTITGVPATSSGPFTATFTFLEDVIGFAVGGIDVNNGAASEFTTTSESIYMALITPASKGTVTVGVAEGAAQDPAGNGNTAATQVTSDYNTAPTGAPGEVTTNRDTDYTFDAADFGFSDADPGDTLDSVKITSLPASGKGALKLSGVEIAAANLPQTVDMNQLDAGSLTYSPPAGEIGDAFAVFQFKVNDGTDDSASPDTMTINVNGPPTLVSAGVPATGDRIVLTFSEVLARARPRTDLFTVTVAGNSSNFFLSTSFAADNEVILVVRSGVNPGESAVVTYTSPTTDASQTIQDVFGFDAASFTTGSDDVPEVQNNSANHRPTSSSSKVTTPRDTDYTFKVTDFNFMDDDAGDVLEKVVITSRPRPDRGEGTLMLDGNAIPQSRLPLTVSMAKLADGDLTYSPPPGQGGADFATFRFKVNDGAVDSVSADTMTIDVGQNTALQVVSIERWDPSSSPTNSDTLTWRVTFSKDVANVDAADFGVTGTTATLAASADANVADVWDVKASGGDLASRNNTVTLSFAAGQNIQDTAGNALSDTEPTATNDDDYVVDNTAPTAPSYTAPSLLQVGETITEMSPGGGIGIDEYGAPGLPSGLAIDAATGVISGMPDSAGASATVTVTVSDAAGNTDTVDIEFPAVDKGDQTLTGFAYSASSVQFGADAPTLTEPSGAQTTLSYSVSGDSVSVCSVDPTSGVLTINGVGACAVTVTAEGTANYNEASVAVTVTVQSTGTLVLNVGVIATDDTINIAEKAAGFAIAGDTGSEAGVAVTVTVGAGTLTATSAAAGGWSVSVPADASYVTATSVALEVTAEKAGFTSPSAVQRPLTVDLTAPAAPAYTEPVSLQVGVPITMSPGGGSDIDEYGALSLPSGLAIDAGTGAITGTPDTAHASPAGARVTVSDAAGNTAAVNLVFPAVDKGDQTLSGFAYSPASVAFGSTAPTPTGPSGAQTTVSYSVSEDSVSVCSVDPNTGELTINGVGACAVTATAAGSANYNEASAPFTVTVTDAELTLVTVTIAAEHASIGAGLEDLKFTLTREGDATEELVATVTIDQDESWLGNSDLSHTVTFPAGDATTTLTIDADRFSFDLSTKGDLTATVSGDGISGGEDTVEIVSTSEPPITISYDMSSYAFEEDADDEAIYAVATLHTAYPRPPANFFFSFSARSGTAGSPEDYNAISWSPEFMGSDFVRDIDTGPFVARKTVPFLLVNDDVYEGSEQFEMILEPVPGLRLGLVQSAHPNGATCEAHTCTSFPRYPVTITDEEDRPELSLSAAPASIARQDDSGTAGIEENVSTLTTGITNGKTFWTDRTVTLDFGGTAVEGTDYSVNPADADPVAAGHQVVLQGGASLLPFYNFEDEEDEDEYDDERDGEYPGESSVEVTVTAMANAAVDVNRTVEVSGDLDGTDIGSTLITILPAGTTAVTIAAEHESIGAGLDDLVFELMRVGDTTDELVATVTIVQVESWLGNSDLSHTVTFPAGDATTTLTIDADRFSFDPSTKGDLTATVSGDGISGGEDTVEIVSTSEPPITISYDMSSYAFEEDADDEAIYAVATLHTAYPRPPASFFVSFSSREGTAGSPEDYNAISWFPEFMGSEFVRDIDTGPFVARKTVPFLLVNDDVYEGSEQFEMIMEQVPGLRTGLVQFAHPNGATCEATTCSTSFPRYPVTVTDEEDRPELSLSAAPASIARQDDSGTAGIEENVSTLTAGITNGKTFWTDRTVTLDFGGTAVEGTDYSVNPADADPVAAGHQVVLQGGASLLPFYDFEDEEDEDEYDDERDGEYPGESSVEVTVTAMANAAAEGNRTVEVSGELDGTDIGSTLITIIPNTFPLASNSTVTTEENTDFTFSAGDFNFTDADAGDELASVTVVTLPAAGALALDGAAVTAGEAVAVEDIGKLVFTPAANANGDAYTSFTFRVSDGTAESVDTYTMTVNVTPVNDAPTGASNTVTTEEDTDYTFSAGDFNFSDADAGDDLASVTVVTLPAAGALALDGAAVVAGQAVAAADIGKLVFTPAANANGDAYTSFTFRVSDGTAESVDTYTMTVNVTPVNDAPTGVPTIGGMAWPGGTLTADTSGVDDADGMTGVTLAYQWTRLDPEGVLNPVQVGTDSRIYAPAAADIGSNIAVTVSFTDDGNNVEELTSAAVGPVVAEPVTVTIAANHDIIGAGLEDLVFTLTREGDTAEELDATVTIAQQQEWLDDSDLSHTVTFLAGEPTATLTLSARRFSFDPDTSGDLTATVSGVGISGGSDTVDIVSTSEPPITVSYDESAYTFAENGVDAAIYAVLTLHPAYPRAPSKFEFVSFSSRSGTAESPDDYPAISWVPTFIRNDFVRDAETDPHVARKPVPGFHIVNDVVYEGSEHFTMIIEQSPGLRSGLVQVALPNGNTCDLGSCSPTPHFPVEITDEEDLPALSLWASPESIDEEDDSATQDAENVSTVTVQIINGTTLPADRTVTLRFTGGTAIENSHFSVSPPDADPNATGHQVVLPAGDTSVEATVIAVANDTADGPRTVEVSGELGARDIGRTFITILDDETTSANNDATGRPTIAGTPRIGRVLTAHVSAILDADGLPSSFDYQWVRVNASDSETVVGSNRTYMPTLYDLGSTFRVQVRFIDAAGNAEGPLASDPTAAVMGVSCKANAVWCTTLTVGDGGDPPPPGGYCGPGTGTPNCDYGSLVDDRFTLDGTDYTVESVRWGSSKFHFTLDKDFPSARLGSLTLLISINSLDLSDANDSNLNNGAVTNNYRWSAGDVGRFSSLPAGTPITVQLLAGAANTGATGRPEIEGTAQVGQELTAGMGNIADADGLPSSFAYQWVRVDSRGRETSVGTNSSTYAVLSADVGSTIRVEVSFTDGAGNEEGPLASDPTATVVEADRTLTLTVDPPSVAEDAGATQVEVTGTLDGAPRTSVTEVAVTVGASDDTATEGTDYATVGDLTLTIEAGEASGTTTFTLTPTDDAVDEEDAETLSVTGTTAASGLVVVPTAVTIAGQ